MGEWMGGWVDRQMGGWVDRWMDGWEAISKDTPWNGREKRVKQDSEEAGAMLHVGAT